MRSRKGYEELLVSQSVDRRGSAVEMALRFLIDCCFADHKGK